MSQSIVSIDGTYYDIRIPENGIKRSFSILDSDSAGRLQSGVMKRSIIGTYYNYTIQLDTSALNPTQYDTLYTVISAPVESHEIVVPYGQTVLTFDAYVTGGEDHIKVIKNGTNEWEGLSLQFIAMEPERTPY